MILIISIIVCHKKGNLRLKMLLIVRNSEIHVTSQCIRRVESAFFKLLMKYKAVLANCKFLDYLSVFQNVDTCACDVVSHPGRLECSFHCCMLLEFTLYFSTNVVKFTLRYCKLFAAESLPLQRVAAAPMETK